MYDKELKSIIVKEELRAVIVKHHPALFNSLHEGFAVLKEEQEEFQEEYKKVEANIDKTWKSIKGDFNKTELEKILSNLTLSYQEAFDEFVMLCTMVEKLKTFLRNDNGNNRNR